MILIIVLIQDQTNAKLILMKIKKKKRGIFMTNETIAKFIGKNCVITSGSFSFGLLGKILNVNENWIELQTKKEIHLVNTDFITSIKITGN
jgi:hypothetical protein